MVDCHLFPKQCFFAKKFEKKGGILPILPVFVNSYCSDVSMHRIWEEERECVVLRDGQTEFKVQIGEKLKIKKIKKKKSIFIFLMIIM